MKLFPFLLAFLLSTVGLAQDTTWATLTTEEFTIDYPLTWTVDQSGTMGTEVFIFDAPTHDDDLFSENVNVMLDYPMSDTVTLKGYGDWSKALLPKYITNFELITSDYKVQNDIPIYTIEYKGVQGSFNLYFKQFIAFKDDVFYILTFTAEQDQVEIYQSTAKQLLDSFRWAE